MTTIQISRDLSLETEGSVSGIACGVRESGVTVARRGEAPKIHLIPPARMAYAPALFDLVTGVGDLNAVKTTSDGRIVADPRLANVETILAKVDLACGDGRGRGGFPNGTHGVYTIEPARDGWRYIVQTTPSGRASLKKIATWTGVNGRFLVAYTEAGALAAILERAVTARVKGETTTITLPTVPGVSVRIEGGEILVCPAREDNEIVRAVPSLRWDPARGAYAVSTRYSKRLAKALEEVTAAVEERSANAAEAKAAKQVEIDRIEADAPRIRTLMAEALSGFAIVRLQGRIAHLAFPYDERSVDLARGLPRAKWDASARTWSTAAETDADVAAIAGAVKVFEGRAQAARAAQAQERVAKDEAERLEAADRAAKGVGRYLDYANRAPDVGDVVMVEGKARVVTGLGRIFVADEDTSSMGGPIGDEGERLRSVHYRAATDEEGAVVLADEADREAKAKSRQAVDAVRCRVRSEGEEVDLGREPEGEVLADDRRSEIRGWRTWMVLDAEGGLWAMTYDGTDGGAWGTYNYGYNTRGWRLQLTPDEIAAFRDAIRRSNE